MVLMDKEKIIKTEVELLSAAIDRIIESEVSAKSLSSHIPLVDDLPDGNAVIKGKVSVLFVDIRHSTSLPDKFNAEQLVKIYRSYIRTVVQAIRYSDGYVRDFMGDGVLAVFVDDANGNKAEDRAVHAARYITTTIDKFLNPKLDKKFKYRISCGIGIHTGDVSISKVGMKGREQDETAENEYGVAWIGNSTNLACKYSGAVDCGDIFISASTYTGISDIDERQNWAETEIPYRGGFLKGYLAQHHYLALDNEVTPVVATTKTKTVKFAEFFDGKLEEIAKRSKLLGEKESQLKIREEKLSEEKELFDAKSKSVKVSLYYAYKSILNSAFCKKEYTISMGQSFWENILEETLDAGIAAEMTEQEVKQDICYMVVNIFENLGLYDKAYDYLVIQALGGAWLLKSTVQTIVSKVRYCSRLIDALYIRLSKKDLTPENKKEFTDIKNWLVFDFKP